MNAMTLTDPLEVNRMAYEAGETWASLKRQHAEKEAARKGLQLKIRDELMEQGAKKTEALEQAKDDERYLHYLSDLADLAHERDVAEVEYRTLYQRAALLAGIKPDDQPF